MTASEDTLLILSDAIKRLAGVSLNQTDVTAELERIEATYTPPTQTPAQIPRDMWVSGLKVAK
jgi:transposase